MQTRNESASFSGSRQELFRWKRFTQNKTEKTKPQLDYDDIEQWVKKVEQASEFAVSKVFSYNKPHLNGKPQNYALNLETTDQLREHDEAYIEAHELLNYWMDSKLRMKMVLDEEDEGEDNEKINTDTTHQEVPSFLKCNKFDDLYNCLEQEMETTSTQDFCQALLQKEMVNSGILEDLGFDEDRPRKAVKDPRLTMELRHQQVKENRLKRQAQLEHQRREKALKKSALSEAQQLQQEEEKKRILKARKEEGEIQREMVKLRKEMNDKRVIMEEAKKMERQRLELEKAQKILIHNQAQHPVLQMDLQSQHDQERRKQEKMKKLQEILKQIDTNNLKCLYQHFSAWHQVVVERKLMMGKNKATSDWKRQLHAFRAWRSYVWARRAEHEAQLTEKSLREENRKQQLAMQCYKNRVLRHFFTEWQLWCKGEREKREQEMKKEETKRKMAALLDAASSGKLYNEPIREPSRDKEVKHESGQTDAVSQKLDEKQEATGRVSIGRVSKSSNSHHVSPQHAWQVTRKHAALQPQDLKKFRDSTSGTSVRSSTDVHQLPGSYSSSVPAYGSNFQHRHAFQQQVIEEQRKQLLEQKHLIHQLQEDQKLMILRQEAEHLTAVTSGLKSQSQNRNHEKERETEPDVSRQQVQECAVPSSSCAAQLEAQRETESTLSSSKRIPNYTASPHPFVKAMEERALQRAKRKKELEEARRKREEEKLACLRAEEEERQRKEEAEKHAQIEKKREERRLQKERELEKQKQAELEVQLKERADQHYQHFLKKKRGITPWMKLIAKAKQNSQLADEHYCAVIQRRCLLAWHYTTNELLEEKTTRANEFYRFMLLRRYLHNWLKCEDFSALLEEKAVKHHLATLKRKTFLVWVDHTNEEKIASWKKKKIATEHNQRRVILSVFHAWRRFPKIMKEEKQREERREQLRKKVAEILPDFKISQ